MNEFEEKLKNAFKPGSPAAKYSFGLLFFSIALLIILIGFWKTLFVGAMTMVGVFIGSAETIGKATAKLIDRIYPQKNQKIVYTQEDLEKVRKAAEKKHGTQQKTEETKVEE